MKLVAGALAVLFLLVTPLLAFMAVGEPAPPAPPGPAALGDIPPDLLPVYQTAAARCALPWEVLAAWGKVASETDGRLGPTALPPILRAGQGEFTPADVIGAAAAFLCDQGATDPARLAAALTALGADVARILNLARIYRTPVHRGGLDGRLQP